MTSGSWRQLGNLNTERTYTDENLLVMKVRLTQHVNIALETNFNSELIFREGPKTSLYQPLSFHQKFSRPFHGLEKQSI